MRVLLIVYDSRTGNTEEMAKAVYEGALSAGVTVSLKRVTEATTNDLLNCYAVIFGTPTNFGYMAGTIKEFFDQAWLSIGDKPASRAYCAFTCSRTGTEQALNSIDTICNSFTQRRQFKFYKALEGVIASPKPSPEVLQACREMGRKMASL